MMPFFQATPHTLPSNIVEPLAEKGSEVPLANLANDFLGVVAEDLPDENSFEVSVRIYRTLKVLEEQEGNYYIVADPELSTANLTKLTTLYATLEYFLYTLNRSILLNSALRSLSLRHNPFLTHWVEAVSACEGQVEAWRLALKPGVPESKASIVTKKKAYSARLIVLRAILKSASDDEQAWEKLGMKTARQVAGEETPTERTDLRPFVEMLYETEVWDRPAEDKAEKPDTSANNNTKSKDTTTVVSASSSGSGSQSEKYKHATLTAAAAPTNPPTITLKDVQAALRSDPTSTYHYLTHLRIDLPNLELINSVLASSALHELGIEPLELARNFIQHGLRDIEAMGTSDVAGIGLNELNGNGSSSRALYHTADFSSSPPLEFLLSTNASNNAYASNPGPSSTAAALPPVVHDRASQTRAIRLLVLFMKNLIKKGLVAGATDAAGLLYEIEEVCVRYMFVPEVRAFRRWVEGEDEIVDE